MLQKKQQERQVSDSRLREIRELKVSDTRFQFEEGTTFTVSNCTAIENLDTHNEREVLVTSIGFINLESRERTRHYLLSGERYVPDGELDRIIQNARKDGKKSVGDTHDKIREQCKGKTFVCKYKRIDTDDGKKSVLHLCLFAEKAPRSRATK